MSLGGGTGQATLTLGGNWSPQPPRRLCTSTAPAGGGSPVISTSAYSATFSGPFTGTGGLIVESAAGLLTLTASNGYSGGTTISGGHAANRQRRPRALNNSTSSVLNNGTLAFNQSDMPTFTPNISGSGGLAELGTGTLTVDGQQYFHGHNHGRRRATLQLGSAYALYSRSHARQPGRKRHPRRGRL